MTNDPASGGEQQQPAWHGQQPYPGGYGQHADQPAYPGGGYGQPSDQPAYPGGGYAQPSDQPAYPGGGYGQQGGEHGGAGYPGGYPQPGGYGQAPQWAPPGQPGQQTQRGPAGPGGPPTGGPPAGLGPGGAGQGGPGGLGQHGATGTFGALFDFSFNTFATPAVIRVLYILGLVAIGLGWVVFVISAFLQGAGYGLLALVLGAVGALFYVIFYRVLLEFYYAIVRMSEDIRAMRERS
jgi:hypothetical protein